LGFWNFSEFGVWNLGRAHPIFWKNWEAAQVSKLLYRGASSLQVIGGSRMVGVRDVSRLEIGDTAGWKPALRQSHRSLFKN